MSAWPSIAFRRGRPRWADSMWLALLLHSKQGSCRKHQVFPLRPSRGVSSGLVPPVGPNPSANPNWSFAASYASYLAHIYLVEEWRGQNARHSIDAFVDSTKPLSAIYILWTSSAQTLHKSNFDPRRKLQGMMDQHYNFIKVRIVTFPSGRRLLGPRNNRFVPCDFCCLHGYKLR